MVDRASVRDLTLVPAMTEDRVGSLKGHAPSQATMLYPDDALKRPQRATGSRREDPVISSRGPTRPREGPDFCQVLDIIEVRYLQRRVDRCVREGRKQRLIVRRVWNRRRSHFQDLR